LPREARGVMRGGIKTTFANIAGAVSRLTLTCFAASAVLAGASLAGAAEASAEVAAAAGDPERGWLLTALNVAAVVCFALWWRWMDRKPTAPAPSASLALAPIDEAAETGWKARALAAEARADKAAALLKTRLMPQLARWMMGELVQRLLHQRTGLLSSQQRAEQEVAELEQRLEKLHAPLEDRLKAYERRIADLERELAAKGQENRELLKARIDTARKKLASERAKSPVAWN
jgi:hypothetical protein